jgi:hypothetical protein
VNIKAATTGLCLVVFCLFSDSHSSTHYVTVNVRWLMNDELEAEFEITEISDLVCCSVF